MSLSRGSLRHGAFHQCIDCSWLDLLTSCLTSSCTRVNPMMSTILCGGRLPILGVDELFPSSFLLKLVSLDQDSDFLIALRQRLLEVSSANSATIRSAT